MTTRVTALQPKSRESIGADLMVTISHPKQSTVLMMTVEEARALALGILRETEKFALPARKEA